MEHGPDRRKPRKCRSPELFPSATPFGATHWSSRLLTAALVAEGTPISHVTIARIWHRFGVQPWRAGTFTFPTDPELEGKIGDVVGLHLHPPAKAVVLCVDEKPQVQDLQRIAPALLVRPGSPERQTFDYVRHGTTTLFAALEVATGRVTDACTQRHRHQEFWPSSGRSPPIRAVSCMSWSTTSPRTSIQQSASGWPDIRLGSLPGTGHGWAWRRRSRLGPRCRRIRCRRWCP
jgi:hypothetical protein